jgi:hypothetical protein
VKGLWPRLNHDWSRYSFHGGPRPASQTDVPSTVRTATSVTMRACAGGISRRDYFPNRRARHGGPRGEPARRVRSRGLLLTATRRHVIALCGKGVWSPSRNSVALFKLAHSPEKLDPYIRSGTGITWCRGVDSALQQKCIQRSLMFRSDAAPTNDFWPGLFIGSRLSNEWRLSPKCATIEKG